MTQPARDHVGGAFVQYDYTNQAWLHNGVYQKCGHLQCNWIEGYENQCYGSKHEGEVADPNAHIEPSTGPLTEATSTPCTYDPTPLLGQPIGMLHCPLCGEMVLAGLPHP